MFYSQKIENIVMVFLNAILSSYRCQNRYYEQLTRPDMQTSTDILQWCVETVSLRKLFTDIVTSFYKRDVEINVSSVMYTEQPFPRAANFDGESLQTFWRSMKNIRGNRCYSLKKKEKYWWHAVMGEDFHKIIVKENMEKKMRRFCLIFEDNATFFLLTD